MGNPRWLPGSSLAPHFSIFHSFIHHSAFKLDLHEGTYELTVLKGDVLDLPRFGRVTSKICKVGNHFLSQ